MTGLLCYLWWFLLGLLLGWLLHWLLGRSIQKNVAPEARAPIANGGGDYQAGFVAGQASAKRSMQEQIAKAGGASASQGLVSGASGPAGAAAGQGVGPGASSLLAGVSPQGLMLAAAARTKSGQDDLRVVEGIGPKINELLIATGIDTFEKLATVPVERVQTILDNAGPHFRLANPVSWAKQARLCADGQWDALQQLQDALTAGVDKSQSAPNADGPHA